MSEAAGGQPRTPRHVWDYWRMAWKGRRVLALTTGTMLVVAIVGTLLLPKRYRAEALVEINLSPSTVLGTEAERSLSRVSWSEQERAFKSEFVRMETREMLERTIERHGLAEKVPALGSRDRIAILKRALDADMLPQTRVARLTVSWNDPEVAALVANAVARTYVDSDLEDTMALLRERKQRLELSAQEKGGVRKAEILRQLSVIQSRPDVETLLALPAMKDNPALEDLRGKYSDADRDVQRLLQVYGDRNPQVLEAVGARNRLRSQLDREVDAVKTQLVAELRSLGGSPDDPLPEEDTRAGMLTSEAAETIEREIHARLSEQEVLANTAEPKAKIIDPAQPPAGPYSPKLGLNVALALVLGLGFGGAVVFFRDYLDTSVRTIEDLERDLELPLLAVVPRRTAAMEPVIREAFHTARTGLLFSSGGRTRRVILVSAAGPQEGKTTIVADLARSLSGAGDSVAVVDCDLRRPAIARELAVNGARGLTNLLADPTAVDARQLLQRAGDRLDVMPAGPVPPNPLDLLSLPRFKELLKQLASSHDWVLLDSPPLGSVSDGIVLASLADMVVLAVRHDQTDKDVLRRTLARLRSVGTHVAGAILNDVDMSRAYNREYYYGRFYYGRFYGEGDGRPAGEASARERKVAGR